MDLRRRKEEVCYEEEDDAELQLERLKKRRQIQERKKRPRRRHPPGNLKTKEIVPVFKYFYPHKAYRLPGDYCIPNFTDDEHQEYFSFSTISYLKTIQQIDFDEKHGIIEARLNSVQPENYGVPWEYIVDRMSSMNEKGLKDLSESIKNYCLCFTKYFKAINQNNQTEALILKHEADLPFLKKSDIPMIWLRRKRIGTDSVQDKFAINLALVKMLGFSASEVIEKMLEKGIPPVFAKAERVDIVNQIMKMNIDIIQNPHKKFESKYLTSHLDNRGAMKLAVDVVVTIHLSLIHI
eukprot:TRINITY_DN11238_c0_g1_i3.p1 TRINITY_DN11238_c0_g1~~TRINITY_DN11238_c0_g1_i3.p1  ORF type:complete len:294 (-),score=60.74 TRINITY_DN11238_c0_g1_i3:61-942(-)